MGYYMRGDYYRGDYYRGDFWSTLGGIAKKGLATAVGAVKGALTGGPYGAVIGAVKNVPHFGPAGGGPGGPPAPPAAAISGLPTFKGLNPFGGPPTGSPTVPPGMMRGYHLNKAKLGPTKAHPKGAAPHTVLVRNRHMNVANPRALARASRRAHGFLKMSRHFVRYFTPKAHKGKAYIARRKRSR